VTLLYSGLFFGVLPEEGISWESHLMGAFVGIGVAYLFKNSIEPDEEAEKQPYEIIEEPEEYFLPRDVFGNGGPSGQSRDQGGFWTSDTTHEDSSAR
jgi:hypothetical protein